jgi:hypothetical protein
MVDRFCIVHFNDGIKENWTLKEWIERPGFLWGTSGVWIVVDTYDMEIKAKAEMRRRSLPIIEHKYYNESGGEECGW